MGGFFNVVRLGAMVKVDLYVRPRSGIHAEEIRRAAPARVGADPERVLRLATAEDTVLQRLRWFQEGEGASDRPWRDVIGVLETAADRIDRGYPERWAEELDLAESPSRAMREAGLG